jgi:hypothetical protein
LSSLVLCRQKLEIGSASVHLKIITVYKRLQQTFAKFAEST